MAAFWSKKPFQKHHESQERAEVSSGTLKIASAALLETPGLKTILVTSKSGLEEFLDRQDGDTFLWGELPWPTAEPPGRGRGGVGTPKKVTFV